MLDARKIATVFERDYAPSTASAGERVAGAMKWSRDIRKKLGFGKDSRNNAIIENATWSAQDFPDFKDLARAFLKVDSLDQAVYEVRRAINPAGVALETAVNGLAFEDVGAAAAVVPGNLPNVSAYLGTVSGLLDAAVLEGYTTPGYIHNNLCVTIPSKVRQKQLLGTGRLDPDAVQQRNPGDPHPRVQFEERYVTTPETQNKGLSCEVTFHAVFFDQTDEVLERARQIGDAISLSDEKEFMRLFAGVTNAYRYRGTDYNTYLTSGNWINDQVNILEDWTNINKVKALKSRMTDQETGNRLSVTLDTLVCSPFRFATAEHIRNNTTIQERTKSQAHVREGSYRGMLWENTFESEYLDEILTTASPNGLALGQADANEYWWMVNTSPKMSAFIKTENWPFSTKTAAPNDHHMLDHDLLLAVFANRQQAFSVREPRGVIRNKPS